jgi:hypothetical protein
MAEIPQQAIKDWHTVKPSSYAAFCLMCQVKDTRSEDVYLDQAKASEYGIKKSAYYYAFDELESENWIAFSRKADGKKWWKLLKGFSANVEIEQPIEDENSANVENENEKESISVENSANTEKESEKIPQTWNENSANVESPLEPPIRININQKEIKPKYEESLFVVRLSDSDTELRSAIAGKIGEKKKTEPVSPEEWVQIVQVFDNWKRVFRKNRSTRLTAERGRAILDRLRSIHKFTVEEIEKAIKGCRASPNHNGTNDGKVYDEIELICRTDQFTERFIGYYEVANQNGAKNAISKNGNGNYRNGKQTAFPSNQRTDEETLALIGASPKT